MTTDGIICQVYESFDGLESSRGEWDQAVLDLGGTIYMTYDWARTWWRFYGAGRQLRIYQFRREGRLIGILPLYLDRIGFPGIGLTVARLVGASIPPKVFDPPIGGAFAEEIWTLVVEKLFRDEGCDVLSFGPVAAEYPATAGLAPACARMSKWVCEPQIVSREVQTIYYLPKTYDEYFASLDSKERKTRRKKLRELEAVHAVRTEVLDAPEQVGGEFEEFVLQHTTQWQSEGRPGHFHAWPNALDYNRALVETLGKLGRVRFYKLYGGDTVITRQYTYVLGNTLYAELPARAFGEQWDRHSLGCTSQIKLLEDAIRGGVTRMDSGLGHYEYKILTGGKETPVQVIYLHRKGASSALRIRCWQKFNELLKLCLHKVWYRKVMPRLPKAWRSGQSELLMRLDF